MALSTLPRARARAPLRVLSLLAAALTLLSAPPAAAQERPDLVALQAAGLRIGEVRIVAQDIFDTADAQEDRALFRLANRLHRVTRPEVVRRELLFASGEPLDARRIDESERRLRGLRLFHEVRIVPLAVHDNRVDLEVRTRDTWSLDPGFSAGRAGGSSSGGFALREYNLAGSGIAIGLARSRDVDRDTREATLSVPRLGAAGSRLELGLARTSDGHRRLLGLRQGFDALDDRSAWGLELRDEARIDRLYAAGEETGGHAHQLRRAELMVGRSDGLHEGRVRRWSAGLAAEQDRYGPAEGLNGPAALPADRRWRGPWLQVEHIDDRWQRELNRDLIGRPEYFALGLRARVRMGRNLPAWGGSDTGWRLNAEASHGQALDDGTSDATAGTRMSRLTLQADRRPDGWQTRLGLSTQLYRPQDRRRLLYAAISADAVWRPDPAEPLRLGGDNGLRGYPLRYQSGERRVLATLEQRFYTDLYLWRLLRIGGAVFADVGRAWGGADANAHDPGWLGDVGAGLRVVSTRSAFANVLHLDVAVPLGAHGDIRRWQWGLKTHGSF